MPELVSRNSAGNSENARDQKPIKPEKISEKKLFAFIGLIGIVSLFFGFLRLSQFIKSPFMPEVIVSNTATFLSQTQIGQIDALKNKDTDGDGLSDYNELYFHRTSPYLNDSDSDGISDKQEMDSGSDPNCPVGQTCISYGTDSNANTSSVGTNAAVNSSASATNSPLLSGEATASALRETLKNAGVPQNVLDGTSDAELLEVYNQTIQETQADTNASNANTASLTNINPSLKTNASADTNATSQEMAEVIRSLSPEEVRQFLLSNGLTESDLSGLDDVTLQAILLKALEDQSATNTNQ